MCVHFDYHDHINKAQFLLQTDPSIIFYVFLLFGRCKTCKKFSNLLDVICSDTLLTDTVLMPCKPDVTGALFFFSTGEHIHGVMF